MDSDVDLPAKRVWIHCALSLRGHRRRGRAEAGELLGGVTGSRRILIVTVTIRKGKGLTNCAG